MLLARGEYVINLNNVNEFYYDYSDMSNIFKIIFNYSNAEHGEFDFSSKELMLIAFNKIISFSSRMQIMCLLDNESLLNEISSRK